MKVEVIKHFIDGAEYGYYLVDGKIVVQNGDDIKAIPFLSSCAIKDSLLNITQIAKDEIKKAIQYYDCHKNKSGDCANCQHNDCPHHSDIVLDEFVGKIGNIYIENASVMADTEKIRADERTKFAEWLEECRLLTLWQGDYCESLSAEKVLEMYKEQK